MSITLRIRAGVPTDEPPNFMTRIGYLLPGYESWVTRTRKTDLVSLKSVFIANTQRRANLRRLPKEWSE